MRAVKNADGSFTVNLTEDEAKDLQMDFRELDRHFDLSNFFEGEKSAFERLVETLRDDDANDDDDTDDNI
jgi:hypothetical protein